MITYSVAFTFQRLRESTSNFCTVCKLYYKDNYALRLHLVKALCSQREKAIFDESEKFGCHRCEAAFPERPSLIRHLLFQCSHKQDLACNKCAKIFATDEEYTQHIMTCVMRRTPLNPVMPSGKQTGMACPKCGCTFSKKDVFTRHTILCKAKPVNISPVKIVSEVEKGQLEKYGLTPCKIKLDKVPDVLGTRLPTGRLRRTPKKYADEAFEKGWVDTRDSKPECTLQTTKPKPVLQFFRLADGKVLQAVGQAPAVNKTVTASGSKYIVKNFPSKSWKVVSPPKAIASTSKKEEEAFLTMRRIVESKGDESNEAVGDDNQEKTSIADTEDTITVSLDDPEMIGDVADDDKETVPVVTDGQNGEMLTL